MESKKEKIEEKIEQIEDYVNSCKFKSFSNSIILVDKNEIDEYLLELKKCAPEEIKRYQKIIANRTAILAEAEKVRDDAKLEAQDIINKAINQTNELISEHEIMQKAYDQANDIINQAAGKAQEIIDAAVLEANNLKESATAYTDGLLAHVEELTAYYINSSGTAFNNLIGGLNEYLETVRSNRAELYPPMEPEVIQPGNTTDFIPVDAFAPGETSDEDLPDLELI